MFERCLIITAVYRDAKTTLEKRQNFSTIEYRSRNSTGKNTEQFLGKKQIIWKQTPLEFAPLTLREDKSCVVIICQRYFLGPV